MKAIAVLVLCAVFLSPQSSFAWSLFGPDSLEECIADKANKASVRNAGLMLQRACECTFQRQNYYCGDYSPDMCDCILDDMPEAQTEGEARSIYLKCLKKNTKKK